MEEPAPPAAAVSRCNSLIFADDPLDGFGGGCGRRGVIIRRRVGACPLVWLPACQLARS